MKKEEEIQRSQKNEIKDSQEKLIRKKVNHSRKRQSNAHKRTDT